MMLALAGRNVHVARGGGRLDCMIAWSGAAGALTGSEVSLRARFTSEFSPWFFLLLFFVCVPRFFFVVNA